MGFPDSGRILLFCPERFPHGGFALGRGFRFLPPAGRCLLGRAAARRFLDGRGCWFGFLSRGFHLGRGLRLPPAGWGGFPWLGFGLSSLHRRGPAPRFWRWSLLHPVKGRDSAELSGTQTLPGVEPLALPKQLLAPPFFTLDALSVSGASHRLHPNEPERLLPR